jgi:hypothetical protein
MDVVGQAFEVGQSSTGAASLAQWIESQVSGSLATHLLGTVNYKVSQEEYVLALMATTLAKAATASIGNYVASGIFDVRADQGAGLISFLNAQQAGLSAPTAPVLSTITAGSLESQGTLSVKVALVNAAGVSIASTNSTLAVGADTELVVASPAAPAPATTTTVYPFEAPAPATPGAATGWNVYVGPVGEETLQNSTPLAFGTSFTLTTLATTTGAAAPTTNTTGAKYLQSLTVFDRFQDVYVVPVLSN